MPSGKTRLRLPDCSGVSGHPDQSLKCYQYSTEGQKCHQNLAPVLVVTLLNSLVSSRKSLPVQVFTGIAPRHASTSSGKTSVSH